MKNKEKYVKWMKRFLWCSITITIILFIFVITDYRLPFVNNHIENIHQECNQIVIQHYTPHYISYNHMIEDGHNVEAFFLCVGIDFLLFMGILLIRSESIKDKIGYSFVIFMWLFIISWIAYSFFPFPPDNEDPNDWDAVCWGKDSIAIIKSNANGSNRFATYYKRSQLSYEVYVDTLKDRHGTFYSLHYMLYDSLDNEILHKGFPTGRNWPISGYNCGEEEIKWKEEVMDMTKRPKSL